MSESKIFKQPTHQCISLTGVKFEISHAKEFFNPNTARLSPPHIHNCIEIFLNISSDASFFVDNCLYPLQYGDIVVSMPNQIHVCLFNKSYTHEHFCLWVDFGEAQDGLEALFSKLTQHLFRFENEKQTKIIELFYKLESLSSEKDNDLQKTACFLEILSLFEVISFEEEQTSQIPDILQKILNDIHMNFSEIHHINQLTDKYFVSNATLGRWFRKYLHTSPREYLESKKLAHAVKLLDGGATVTEACINSGFPCCSHFIVLFKKKFGETPLKYKKRKEVNI
ncbi:MAG: helix-turn-helix domain-containing protein [Ruminococcaceae bacterium]|nr:helix-turn-helix domain-containing protein [Oscillospiraceae bacterium]